MKAGRRLSVVAVIAFALTLVGCGGSSGPGTPLTAGPSTSPPSNEVPYIEVPPTEPPSTEPSPAPQESTPDVDLVVTITSENPQQTVILGDPILVAVKVANVSDRSATGVTLTGESSVEVQAWAWTANGLCGMGSMTTCSLPDLPAHGTTEVLVFMVGRTTGVLTQRVMVHSNEVDADSSTNQVDLVTTVVAPPDKAPHVVAIPSSAVIGTGDTVTLSAAHYAPDGVPEPDGTVTWNSSNEAVATVDPIGVVTGVAPGSAEVVAMVNRVASQPVVITVAATAQPRTIEFVGVTHSAPGLNGGVTTIMHPARTWLPGVGFDMEVDQARHVAYISMPTRKSVAVLDLTTFSQQEIAVGGTPYGMALGSDGQSLYVAIHEGLVRVVNLSDFTLRDIPLYIDSSGIVEPFDVAVANEYVYVTSRSNSGSRSMRIVNVDGVDRGGPFDWWMRGPAAAPGATLLASPDGQAIYMVEAMSRNLSAFDLTDRTFPRFASGWSFIQDINRMQAALDGNAIYLASGEVRRRDLLDLRGTVSPGVPTFSSDGTRVLVGAHDGFFATDGQVIEHDAVTFERLGSHQVGCAPERMMPVLPAVDTEQYLILGFDSVCLWRYTPTFNISWPSFPPFVPVDHPVDPGTITQLP